MRLLAISTVLALLDLEEVRMIFLLLPAVRVHALVLIGAALGVRANEVVDLPVGAHLARVFED